MFNLNLEPFQWVLAVISGILTGFSKTGINGTGILAIPIMAEIFGGKTSAAIMLPMLITGDIFAIRQYHNHVKWPCIRRLIPWTLAGLILGLLVGGIINDRQFKTIIAISVLICLAIMVWMERRKDPVIPNQWWFTALMGLAGGFTTMIGNAAGPVMTIYLLSMRLPKYDFLGTGAWFFAMLNLLKLPLQIFFWGSISWSTLSFNALMILPIAVGAFLGVKAVRHIPEKPFRKLLLVLAGITAFRLFF